MRKFSPKENPKLEDRYVLTNKKEKIRLKNFI